jgi:hypothetical protein
MCQGHALDDCRHIKIQLFPIGIVSGHWCIVLLVSSQNLNSLIAADRRDDREGTDETSDKDPPMR